MRRYLVVALSGLALTLSTVLAAPAASAASAAEAGPAGFPVPLPTAEGDPPGANDWACVPTVRRPVPVVLVHGTFGDRKHLLERLSASVKAAGNCVYSLDYGNRGTGDVVASARTLKRFVGKVRRATGAPKVSLVGHSQGGMMPRYYLKHLGGAKVVDDLVGIAPSNHGTRLVMSPDDPFFGPVLGILCEACRQQAEGSRFLRSLNSGDQTPGKVSYTSITTRYDEVVVPHTNGHLARGPRTVNVVAQDLCPTDLSEHLLLPSSSTTIAVVLDALARRGPAVPAGLGCG